LRLHTAQVVLLGLGTVRGDSPDLASTHLIWREGAWINCWREEASRAWAAAQRGASRHYEANQQLAG